MPGEASLRAQQYYAHPRNQFWPLLMDLLGMEAGAAYAQRVAALQQAGIAVWDVLHSCVRAGSLDSSIEVASQIPNDFREFFAAHPAIRRVYFNGSAAEQIFRKRVLPQVAALGLEYRRLPSTSPAHAALSYLQKRAVWREIVL